MWLDDDVRALVGAPTRTLEHAGVGRPDHETRTLAGGEVTFSDHRFGCGAEDWLSTIEDGNGRPLRYEQGSWSVVGVCQVMDWKVGEGRAYRSPNRRSPWTAVS